MFRTFILFCILFSIIHSDSVRGYSEKVIRKTSHGTPYLCWTFIRRISDTDKSVTCYEYSLPDCTSPSRESKGHPELSQMTRISSDDCKSESTFKNYADKRFNQIKAQAGK